ncbi:MAG: hypothetical protein KBT34_07305 [Prevotella sp.]|nr:hypothetical protein [Candidatus Prevotella equi]
MAQLQSLGVETHSFNVSLAKEVGLAEAIILQNFHFWHRANVDNPDMTKDGRVWFFRSVKSICDDFCYLTPSKVKTAIEKLVSDGWVLRGDYNSDRMKRVTWYSLTDFTLSLFTGLPIGENRQCNSENPLTIGENRHKDSIIQDNNIYSFTDIKEKEEKKLSSKKESDELFEECWKAYRRKGSKKVAKTHWAKLNDDERQKVKVHIPYYVSAASDRNYQKDFERYLRDRIFETPVYNNNQLVYDPENGSTSIYHPYGNTSIIWDDIHKRYIIMSPPEWGVADGYTDDNRPHGAELWYQNRLYVWLSPHKYWHKEEINYSK